MNYLVTGAAGFIGANVCEQLIRGGHSVYAVDTLNSYYDVRVKLARLRGLAQATGCEDEFAAIFGADALYRSWSEAMLPRVRLEGGNFIFQRLDIEATPEVNQIFSSHR